MTMGWLTAALVLALLIPLAASARPSPIAERLAALSSFATKASVLMLVVGADRDDPMLTLVGVIVLAVGNGGLVLLARALREGSP
jgi:multicomponent Na+:H+ antiporter subunit F